MESVLNAAATQTILEEIVSVNSAISVTESFVAHATHHAVHVPTNSVTTVFHALMLHTLYQTVYVH
jgi:hypothetical protein